MYVLVQRENDTYLASKHRANQKSITLPLRKGKAEILVKFSKTSESPHEPQCTYILT